MEVAIIVSGIISIILIIFHFKLMVDIRRLLTRVVELQEKGSSSRSLPAPPMAAVPAAPGQASAPPQHSVPMKAFEIAAGETYVLSNGDRVKVVAFLRSGLHLERQSGERFTLDPLNKVAPQTQWEFDISKA